jgi:hypothetical protein
VDAADYYDGFGTGEIVVGIRAYQWGWEYFYPKSIDLNYNLNPSFSSVVGNSLKYTSSSSTHLKTNTLWKYHQNKKDNNSTSIPAHLLLLPNDNSNMLNFMNFDELGLSTVKDSSAFKKIQFFSKTNTESIFNIKSDFESNYYRLSSLYNTDLKLMSSLNYGISRQHNYNSLMSTNRLPANALDKGSVDKFFDYNLNTERPTNSIDDSSYVATYKRDNSTLPKSANNLSIILGTNVTGNHQTFNTGSSYPTLNSFIGLETDSKQVANTLRYADNSVLKKKKLLYKEWLNTSLSTKTDLNTLNPLLRFSSKLFNKEGLSKFKNLKSDDLQLLSSERNPRLLGNYNSNIHTSNFTKYDNNLTSTTSNLQNLNTGQDQYNVYGLSQLN